MFSVNLLLKYFGRDTGNSIRTSRRQKRARRSTHLFLESLEPRTLLTSDIGTDWHGPHGMTNFDATLDSGKVGYGASFDGTSYLAAGDSSALSIGGHSFSFAAWINASDLNGYHAIAAKGWGGADFSQYEWVLGTQDDKLFFSVMSGDNMTYHDGYVESSGSLSTDTWYFVVASYDATNDEISVEINAGTPDTESYGYAVNDGNQNFTIGAAPNVGATWEGKIDEAGFWRDHVLTSTEIDTLFNSGNGLAYNGIRNTSLDDDLISYWRFGDIGF